MLTLSPRVALLNNSCIQVFAVADFVGDLCKAMASKIRGVVSSVTFDDFHKNSASIIQKAVFGEDKVSRF